MSLKMNIIYDSHAYCITNLNGNGGFEYIRIKYANFDK